MSQTFSIPQPCHEDWNSMTPASQGRHCAQCCKVVVDFSNWEPAAIEAYLFTQQATSVCGRMREDQVDTNVVAPSAYLYQVMQSGLDFLKKIAAVVVFALFIANSAQAQKPVLQDTVKPMIMGKMIAPVRPPVKHPKVVKRPQHITGLVAPAPYPAPIKDKPAPKPE